MQKYILFLFLFISLPIITFAADNNVETEKEYEYWGDDYFDSFNDSLQTYKVEKRIFEASTGFFPKPILYRSWILFLGNGTMGWNFNTGNVSIGEQFPSHNFIFSAQPPIESNDFEEKIEEKKKFSEKNLYGFFTPKQSSKTNINLMFDYTVPILHTFFSLQLGYTQEYINLYSPIRTEYFLGGNGDKKYFDEISILEIRDTKISTDFNLKHPIYGAFMSTNLELLPNYTELNNISIFYYITYGLGCDITIDGNLNNYEYILSEANNIRYSNGEIREASLFKEEYNGIKKYRYSYNVGIGWQVGGGEGGGASIEIKYRGSLDPIFENSNFRQHNLFFTFNTSIDFYIYFIKGIVSIFKSII